MINFGGEECALKDMTYVHSVYFLERTHKRSRIPSHSAYYPEASCLLESVNVQFLKMSETGRNVSSTPLS